LARSWTGSSSVPSSTGKHSAASQQALRTQVAALRLQTALQCCGCSVVVHPLLCLATSGSKLGNQAAVLMQHRRVLFLPYCAALCMAPLARGCCTSRLRRWRAATC
jgi:hypothetical protein